MITGREIIVTATGNLKEEIGLTEVSYKAYSKRAYDYVLDISGRHFAAILYNSATRSNLLPIIDSLKKVSAKSEMPILLVCGYISSTILDALKREKINFLDASGNCFIKYNGLFIYISGKRNSQVTLPPDNIFNESGIKTISFFLTDNKNVDDSYRMISKSSGVSLGSVQNTMMALMKRKFITIVGKKRRIIDSEGLINLWQTAYNNKLKPKLLIGRMDFVKEPHGDSWKSLTLNKGDEWGGESAAYILDGFLIPEFHTIYTAGSTADLIATKELRPSATGKVFIYKKYWTDGNDSVTAPRHIVYADLMGSGDSRCLEAAKRILKK